MSADAALDGIIAKLRELGHFPADVAKECAPLVLEANQKTARAGTSIDGKAWAPTKSGGRPLVHAAEALSVRVLGTSVQLVLKGVEVIHNFGTKGMPARRILPDGGAGVPKAIREAVLEGARRVFVRATGGQP